mgnify:CR=1 FL=1
MTLAQAAIIAGVAVRTLQQAAKSGTLRTKQTVAGYATTREWLDAWMASKRPGRPRLTARQ